MQITITNGTLIQVQETLSPAIRYELPSTVMITGATSSYNASTGAITLTTPELLINVTADAVKIIEPEPSLDNKISFGNLIIDKMYFGNLLVESIYLGNTKIYKSSSVTLISFTINNTIYQADVGMTWSEWVASAYNTLGLIEYDSYVMSPVGYPVELSSTNSAIRKTDTIIANASYEVLMSASGGAIK